MTGMIHAPGWFKPQRMRREFPDADMQQVSRKWFNLDGHLDELDDNGKR
jgi:hypothetical protein